MRGKAWVVSTVPTSVSPVLSGGTIIALLGILVTYKQSPPSPMYLVGKGEILSEEVAVKGFPISVNVLTPGWY